MAYTPTLDDFTPTAVGNYTPTLDDFTPDSSMSPQAQAMKSAVQYATGNPLTEGLQQGFMNWGSGIKQLIDTGADKLLGTKLVPADVASTTAQNAQFNSLYGGNPLAKTAEFAGQVAPTLVGGAGLGLAKAPAFIDSIAADSTPFLANSLQGAGMVGKGAALGAAQNVASYDPTGQTPYSTKLAEGAILGGLTGGAIHGGMQLPGALLSSPLTAEQLAQNLTAAQGTSTPLGSITGSPFLQKIQNTAMNIPFSGGVKLQKNISDQISDQGENLLQNLSGGVAPQDVGNVLQQGLKDQLSSLQAIKRQNYAKSNDIANQNGVMIGRDNFTQAASNILKEVNSSDELKNNLPSGFVSEVQSYFKPTKETTINSPIMDADGNPISSTKISNTPSYSLENSNIFRSILNDKASENYISGNNYLGNKYKTLSDSLKNDINSGIENSGSDELKNAHQDAQKFYADNIAPWEDSSIAKFTRGNADSDALISSFVKPGLNNDRSNLVQSLISKLPDEQKTVPGFAYLSRAYVPDPVSGVPTFNASTFSKLYNNIGQNTKNSLFGNGDIRNQLDNYNNLVGMNKDLMKSNVTNTQHKVGMGEAIAAVLGHSFVGLPAMIGIGGGITGAANLANRYLSSPQVRENMIKNLINKSSGLAG